MEEALLGCDVYHRVEPGEALAIGGRTGPCPCRSRAGPRSRTGRSGVVKCRGEGVVGDVLAAKDGLGELQPVLEVLERDQGRRTTRGFFAGGLARGLLRRG